MSGILLQLQSNSSEVRITMSKSDQKTQGMRDGERKKEEKEIKAGIELKGDINEMGLLYRAWQGKSLLCTGLHEICVP